MRQELKSENNAVDPNPLNSLLRISSHLAGQVEIRSALRSVKAEIENLLPIDHVDVCLVDDEVIWHTSYEVGIKTRWSLSRSLVKHSPIRSILLSEIDYMLTGNAMEDPRYIFEGSLAEPILKHKLRSRVNVAMKVLGRTIGALNCSSRQPDLYDANTLQRVKHIADVLAPYFYSLWAIEKAQKAAIVEAEAKAREEGLRQGALELTKALEQERQRIGMDLHDQTLADLTRIVRDFETAETPDEKAEIVGSIQDCIQDLRHIIDTAVPSLLEMFGFAHALRIHLERAVTDAEMMDLIVSDETDGQIDAIDPTTRIALFRIAQEAINNAARHAKADRICVTVKLENAMLMLHISDNGIGSLKSVLGSKKGKATGGLAHMRTRARLIAADFRISNAGGTRIEVSLPFPGPAARDLLSAEDEEAGE